MTGECEFGPWAVGKDGYVRRSIGGGRTGLAHRVAYQEARGEIPEGLVIDHLCRNRACINPDHLEAVPQVVNVHRGEPATRTHCPRGHEYTPENTRVKRNPRSVRGLRNCRACDRDRARAYRSRI